MFQLNKSMRAVIPLFGIYFFSVSHTHFTIPKRFFSTLANVSQGLRFFCSCKQGFVAEEIS